MMPSNLPDLDLPEGFIPEPSDEVGRFEDNDAWHLENLKMWIARGDYSRSQTPVGVMFDYVS
jgi:hypothetical protein